MADTKSVVRDIPNEYNARRIPKYNNIHCNDVFAVMLKGFIIYIILDF